MDGKWRYKPYGSLWIQLDPFFGVVYDNKKLHILEYKSQELMGIGHGAMGMGTSSHIYMGYIWLYCNFLAITVRTMQKLRKLAIKNRDSHVPMVKSPHAWWKNVLPSQRSIREDI